MAIVAPVEEPAAADSFLVRDVAPGEADSLKFREGDALETMFHAQTTDKLLLIAEDGRAYTLGGDKLPGGRGHGPFCFQVVPIEHPVAALGVQHGLQFLEVRELRLRAALTRYPASLKPLQGRFEALAGGGQASRSSLRDAMRGGAARSRLRSARF